MNYIKQLRQTKQVVDTIITTKALQLKLVRIIDILKGNILSPTIIADKILLKTIKVTVKDCFIYMLKVIKLFFKPFLLLFTKPY